VTDKVERAVEKGLRYLVEEQEGDGSWGAWPDRPEVFPVAVTGLVGLAFLAHGDTPTRGAHADVVDRITSFLLAATVDLDPHVGLIHAGREFVDDPRRGKGPRPMYGHAFAMTFLAQVYGQEPDAARRERIGEVLRKAIALTQRAQTNDGGWGYTPNFYEDEGTLTVTQLQALRACRDAGILVPRSVIDRGVEFIEKSANEDGSVRYNIEPEQRWRPGVTCAAVVALWNAGQYESPLFHRTKDFVNRRLDFGFSNNHHAEYVAYYLAQAKWVMGGKLWQDFYQDASVELVRLQRSEGYWTGSDEPIYGSTFATAIALIVLQLPYSRLPVYQR